MKQVKNQLTKVIYILLFFVIVIPTISPANTLSITNTLDPINVGDLLKVPKWHWVRVEERKQNNYSNGDFWMEVGDICGIQYDGNLIITKIEGEKISADYTFSGKTLGTPCPINTKISFFDPDGRYYPKTELGDYNDLYNKRVMEETQAKIDYLMILRGDSDTSSGNYNIGDTFSTEFMTRQNSLLVVRHIKKNQDLENPLIDYVNRWGCQMISGNVSIIGFSMDSKEVLLELTLSENKATFSKNYKCPKFSMFFIPLNNLPKEKLSTILYR